MKQEIKLEKLEIKWNMQDQTYTLVLNIDIPLLGNHFAFGAQHLPEDCNVFLLSCLWWKKYWHWEILLMASLLTQTYASFGAMSLPPLKLIFSDLF